MEMIEVKKQGGVGRRFADIHPDAEIDPSAEIGSFVTVGRDVVIGAGTRIGANATVLEGSRIGDSCSIFPGAVIGAVPQDLKFAGEYTQAVIGDHTTVREYVTVNRGTAAKGSTVIGDHCLIMAYCHVAHDCRVGSNVIMSNATQLAGEVVIGDFAVLSAAVLVHQFTRIGAHAMIQGGSKVNKDVPPFIKAGRDPLSYAGVNSTGLLRRGYTHAQIRAVQDIYRCIYSPGMNTFQAMERIEAEFPAGGEREEVLGFLRSSSRGIIRGYFG